MTFQWDPSADQTYSDDSDLTLQQDQFYKNVGHSFTMDSYGHTLTLQSKQIAFPINQDGDGTALTTIDVKNGTFVCDGQTQQAQDSFFGPRGEYSGDMNITFIVENDAQFILQNFSEVKFNSPNFELQMKGNSSLYIYNTEAIIFQNNTNTTDYPRYKITITGRAILSTVNIDSAKNSSMMMVCGVDVDVYTPSPLPSGVYQLDLCSSGDILVFNSSMSFHGATAIRIRTPSLRSFPLSAELVFITSDTATAYFQFDELFPLVREVPAGLFVLGPGKATMQFDGYSGNDPFQFSKSTYKPQLFTIVSQGVVNGGMIIFENPGGATTVETMLQKELIYIDDQPQIDYSRLKFTYEGKYTNIQQII